MAGILIGGRSRRMKRAKTMLAVPGGKTLVKHVADVVEPLVDEVVLLGTGVDVPASLSEVPVLGDVEPGRGPLGGLCSLLRRAKPGWALLVGCDFPRLESAVLRRLLTEVEESVDAVAFIEPGPTDKLAACCALYHSRIFDPAMQLLHTDHASLQKLLHQVRTKRLATGAAEARMLMDVDTPEEFKRFLADPAP